MVVFSAISWTLLGFDEVLAQHLGVGAAAWSTLLSTAGDGRTVKHIAPCLDSPHSAAAVDHTFVAIALVPDRIAGLGDRAGCSAPLLAVLHTLRALVFAVLQRRDVRRHAVVAGGGSALLVTLVAEGVLCPGHLLDARV